MKVNLAAPVNELGYGVHGTNFAVALAEKVDLALFPIGRIEPPSHLAAKLSDLFYMGRTDWGPADVAVRLSQEFDQGVFPPGKENWSYCAWETDKLSPAVVHQLNTVGRLLVPSAWQGAVAAANGFSGVIGVVPEGVDTELFEPISSAPKPKNKVVFCHFGKAELRKNTELIAQAFAKEFREETDKVELRMFISNPFIPETLMNSASEQLGQMSEAIKIMPHLSSQMHVAAHLNSAHVAVFCSRGEGWNLPLIEAMACGLHIVTTDNTGMSEYVTKENSFIVDSGPMVPAHDGVFFRGDRGNWYDPSEDALRTCLRQAYDRVIETGGAINEAGRATAEEYSWSKAADRFIDLMSSRRPDGATEEKEPAVAIKG